MIMLVRLTLRLWGLTQGRSVRWSREVEGDAGRMDRSEKLWWGYKYFVRAVEHAAPGSGIEEHFAGQDLTFPAPAGFVPRTSAVLVAGGDLLSSEHVRPATTAHLFDDVAAELAGADLAIANLETPVAPSLPTGNPPRGIFAAPPLNTSLEMLRVLTGADGGPGFRFFSTANNHALDQGVAGAHETLDVLDAEGCGHVGTARTPAEQADVPVLDLNGISVAVLSWTFSLNGREVPAGHEHVANVLRLNAETCDLEPIARQVRLARERGADLVVACLHWSLEFESYPTRRLMDRAREVVGLGVDVVIGNHPHVVQPLERVDVVDAGTGRTRSGLVAYALGDLTSYHATVPNSMLATVLRIPVEKGTLDGVDVTRVAGVRAHALVHVATFDGATCTDFRLRDLDARHAELTARAGDRPGRALRRELAEIRRLTVLADRVLGPALGPAHGPAQGPAPAPAQGPVAP